jgi:hypothetical protein
MSVMSEKGIRMTGYKEVRRTLGTIHYPYQNLRPNLYVHMREHPHDLEILTQEYHKGRNKRSKRRHSKKTITIDAKRDKMKAILSPADTGEDKEGTVQRPTEVTTTTTGESVDKDKDKIDKQVGGGLSSMKTIRVTNVIAEKKKAGLVL